MIADPFAVAVEHIAWCLHQGMTPRDFYISVDRTSDYRENATGNDAIWLCARLNSDMVGARPELAYPIVAAQVARPIRRAA